MARLDPPSSATASGQTNGLNEGWMKDLDSTLEVRYWIIANFCEERTWNARVETSAVIASDQCDPVGKDSGTCVLAINDEPNQFGLGCENFGPADIDANSVGVWRETATITSGQSCVLDHFGRALRYLASSRKGNRLQ